MRHQVVINVKLYQHVMLFCHQKLKLRSELH